MIEGQHGYQDDGEFNTPGASKKRKRYRPALSCTDCKQRKIKCSRTLPCDKCIQRGAASTCHWADSSQEPAAPVFALENVVESIRDNVESRLAHLESLMNVKPPTDTAAAAKRALKETLTAPSQDNYTEASHSPPFQQEDELETAAKSLELFAGVVEQKPAQCNTLSTAADLRSFEAFTTDSLIWRDFDNSFEQNPRIPLLANLTRRALVEAFLQAIVDRQTAESLFKTYQTETGWAQGLQGSRSVQEHAVFWDLVESGERDFDPHYIAMLAGTFAIACVGVSVHASELEPEDFFDIARIGLEIGARRSKPSMRIIRAILPCGFFLLSSGKLTECRAWLAEAQKAAQLLELDNLGSDPHKMPPEDRSVPSGTLLARELAVRLWWEVVAFEWMCCPMLGSYVIKPDSFTTALPRNFDDDQLVNGLVDEQPQPEDVVTTSSLQKGKITSASFCREMVDLGPIPAAGAELEKYYAKLLDLDDKFRAGLSKFFSGGFTKPGQLDQFPQWRMMVAISGTNARRLRLHRPLMTRAYKDPRFARSAQTCIECSQDILVNLAQLSAVNAPISSLWFLRHHALSAILALYIDVLHDADIGVSWEVSDRKLQNVPAIMHVFETAEASRFARIRDLGKRARLLLEALEDAKVARRQSRVTSSNAQPEDYGQILKRVASSVKATSTPSSSSNSSLTPPAPANWLDDEATRSLLSSLGLLDTSGKWASAPTQSNDPFLWNQSPTFDLATQMSTGFELLDTKF